MGREVRGTWEEWVVGAGGSWKPGGGEGKSGAEGVGRVQSNQQTANGKKLVRRCDVIALVDPAPSTQLHRKYANEELPRNKLTQPGGNQSLPGQVRYSEKGSLKLTMASASGSSAPPSRNPSPIEVRY